MNGGEGQQEGVVKEIEMNTQTRNTHAHREK